jgi:hypothetical protein
MAVHCGTALLIALLYTLKAQGPDSVSYIWNDAYKVVNLFFQQLYHEVTY